MNFFNNQKPTQQTQPQRTNLNVGGCKIKVRRDSSGRVVGYEDNGKCSSGQIKAFTENINFDGEETEEEK